MQCIHVILRFSCLLTPRVLLYPLSHFQLFLIIPLVVSVKFVCNPFFFNLDKLHPVRLEKPPMSFELRISSSLYFNSSCDCTRAVYSRRHRTPIFLSCLGVFSTFTGVLHFSADGALVDGCLAVFPRLTGRTICIYSFFLTI
jgi:hypothetical protein